MRSETIRNLALSAFAAAVTGALASPAAPDLTLELKDYATMPMTGAVDGKGQILGLLSRVNFLREEPGVSRHRFFVNDLNGPLYILDKETRKFTVYLNFNGFGGQPGIFHRLPTDNGFANGFICFEFDPDYAHNGKFYTVHLENPEAESSAMPDNSGFPGFRTEGYELTRAIPAPGAAQREAVLIEWTDTNPANSTFEGTARELMRVQENTRTHPMGDLVFNPTARPGSPDWRVLYIANGDSAAGESLKPEMRANPQRLDTILGKILRIIPDLNEHKETSTVSENGRYRVPKDNPFASTPGARPEIWAYGLRNPARLIWDVDPKKPSDNHLIADVIGLYTWEMVDFIHKGANYGYSLREGAESLKPTNKTAELPEDDRIPVMLDATKTLGMVTPTYPVISYGHVKGGGDAVGSGYVYRGKALPALRGKYIFGDISTGNVWYADYQEMLARDAAHAKDHATVKSMTEMHPIRIRWRKPGETAAEVYESMYPITEWAYHQRGGKAESLPGYGKVSGGRSDIHFCVDSEGELYVLSKSDGVIRKVVAAQAR